MTYGQGRTFYVGRVLETSRNTVGKVIHDNNRDKLHTTTVLSHTNSLNRFLPTSQRVTMTDPPVPSRTSLRRTGRSREVRTRVNLDCRSTDPTTTVPNPVPDPPSVRDQPSGAGLSRGTRPSVYPRSYFLIPTRRVDSCGATTRTPTRNMWFLLIHKHPGTYLTQEPLTT